MTSSGENGGTPLQRHSTALHDTVSQPKSLKMLSNSVLAGYIAGVTGTLAGHPMDSLKVWVQTQTNNMKIQQSRSSQNTQPRGSNAAPGVSRSVSRMMSTVAISSAESAQSFFSRLRALYAGVSGPLLTVGLIQSVNFAVYDTSRRILYGMEHGRVDSADYLNNDSMKNIAIASMNAGAALSLATSPMLVIKTKQQTTGATFGQAIRDAIETGKKNRSSTTGSLRHLFVGFAPHFAAETINRAVYFCTYETCKRSLSAGRYVNLKDRMISAAAAGTACWLVIFPLDAIRSRLYAMPYNKSINYGSLRMAREMYENGGWRSFYRGFAVTIVRAGPVAAAILPVYDMTLEYLNS